MKAAASDSEAEERPARAEELGVIVYFALRPHVVRSDMQ